MAFVWVYLRTHEGDWVFKAIKEKMQVPPEEIPDHTVIPFPNYVSASCLNRFGTYVTRNSKLRDVGVSDSVPRQKAREIVFAQLRAIHADRVIANVNKRTHAVILERQDNLIYFSTRIANREKVRVL